MKQSLLKQLFEILYRGHGFKVKHFVNYVVIYIARFLQNCHMPNK